MSEKKIENPEENESETPEENESETPEEKEIKVEDMMADLNIDTKEQTFRNKCVGVRANIENKIYRMFSMVYTHPSQCSEDDWTALKTGNDTLIVDKRTMAILSHFECQWLAAPGSIIDLEPNILAVACTPKE
jgi:hypothetical protein